MYRTKSNKNIWVLILLLLAGIIVGGFIGELFSSLSSNIGALSFLNVLNYSKDFGITDPVSVDLGIVSFTVGFVVRFSVWGVLGMAVSGLLYKKI